MNIPLNLRIKYTIYLYLSTLYCICRHTGAVPVLIGRVTDTVVHLTVLHTYSGSETRIR